MRASIIGFVYSTDADADGRRDMYVFSRRVYSADGKLTIGYMNGSQLIPPTNSSPIPTQPQFTPG